MLYRFPLQFVSVGLNVKIRKTYLKVVLLSKDRVDPLNFQRAQTRPMQMGGTRQDYEDGNKNSFSYINLLRNSSTVKIDGEY